MNGNQNKLTSAEVSQLWANYMNDSMSICMLKYFKEKVEDTDIRPLLEFALELSETHIQKLTALFKSQNFPIPHGFSDDDVDVDAPPLFTDLYYLYNLHLWGAIGLEAYGLSLFLAANSKVMQYFSQCIEESKELVNRVKDKMLSKGIFIRSPYIPTPNKVDYVHKKAYLTGWFDEKRPLTTLEIATIYSNKQRNELFHATLMGFNQFTKDKKIRECMARGVEITANNIKQFESVFHDNDLPSPGSWDSMVTDSTVPPFSDKLIMFHLSSQLNRGIGLYGTSLGASSRRDIGAMYLKILGKLLTYAEDTAELMIEKGMMEQPPTSVDRDQLRGS